MTIAEARNRVEGVRYWSLEDSDRAQIAEELLWEDVLAVIARGDCPTPHTLAAIALTTKSIDFSRRCA